MFVVGVLLLGSCCSNVITPPSRGAHTFWYGVVGGGGCRWGLCCWGVRVGVKLLARGARTLARPPLAWREIQKGGTSKKAGANVAEWRVLPSAAWRERSCVHTSRARVLLRVWQPCFVANVEGVAAPNRIRRAREELRVGLGRADGHDGPLEHGLPPRAPGEVEVSRRRVGHAEDIHHLRFVRIS